MFTTIQPLQTQIQRNYDIFSSFLHNKIHNIRLRRRYIISFMQLKSDEYLIIVIIVICIMRCYKTGFKPQIEEITQQQNIYIL